MSACAQAKGHKISVADGLLAATSSIYKLTLVARNEKDFTATGIEVINPWDIDTQK